MIKTIKNWAFGIVFFVIYSISGILVLTYANGYNIVEGCNLGGCELKQTSGIFMDFSDENMENSKIYINQIPIVVKKFPLRLSWFNPGKYTITIEKAGFHTWKKSFTLKEGVIKSFRDVTLRPVIFKQNKLHKFNRHSKKLFIKNSYELWAKDSNSELYFITQYSKPIKKAVFLNSSNIILLIDSSVYLIDIDGENKVLVSDEAKDISAKNNHIQIKNYQDHLIEYIF